MLSKILTILFLVSCVTFFEKEKISINQGASTTSERLVDVKLELNNPEEIRGVMLSEHPHFENEYWRKYHENLQYQLSDKEGTHTIYLKYHRSVMSICPILSASIILLKD